MEKLWKVLKVVIFSLGVLTLALLAWGLFTTFVTPLFKSAGQRTADAPTEEVAYEKTEGGYKLVIKRREAQGLDEYLVTLNRDGAAVVKNYRLPTQKYNLGYINIYDASFVPLRGNALGIVLYSAYADDEGASESHVWFLKATDTMSVREVIPLSDIHQSGTGDYLIIGNKRISLPYQQGFRSESFVVPVMIRVGDDIGISAQLSQAGADALHGALEREIKARMSMPSENKEENLGEQCQKARKEMSEALTDRTITY